MDVLCNMQAVGRSMVHIKPKMDDDPDVKVIDRIVIDVNEARL